MKEEQARRLGEYIKKLRAERGMGNRELATKAGVDTAYISRLERGFYKSPRPDSLRGIAKALGIPLADLFAMADYVMPYDLPNFGPYLRAKYGDLPEEAVSALDAYFDRITADHGLNPAGPAPGEDERPVTRAEDIPAEDLV
jgi:transcriptional regulator with XRE-family HTH domain